MLSERRSIELGLVAMLVFLAFGVASARASGGAISGGLKYVSAQRQENGGGVSAENALCGHRNWVATGGGGAITGVALGNDRWMIGTEVGLDLQPRRPDWILAAFNTAPAQSPATITSYAICKKRTSPGSTFTQKPNGFDYDSGGLRYVHREGDITGHSPATIEASCGIRALTGGTGLAFVDHGWLNTSRPFDKPTDPDALPDDAWRASFYDDDTLGASTQAEAICAKRRSTFAHKLHYKQSKGVSVPVNELRSAHVACGQGKVVTGGGVSVTGGPVQAAVTASRPIDLKDGNRIPDDGWKARVINRRGRAKTLKAFAICKET